MTKQIIVGVDGSDQSMDALRWAAYEARRRDAEIRVVSCYHFPVFGNPGTAVSPNSIDTTLYSQAADATVGRAIKALADIDPALLVEGVAELAPAVTGLVDAGDDGALIVLGASGHTGFLEGLRGSVTTGVAHRAHVPVIVIPANPPREFGDSMAKIVVGVDGSAGSLQALEWAYDEAVLAGAELTVVHGWAYPYVGRGTMMTESRTGVERDARQELQASIDSLGARATDGSVTIHGVVVERSPAEALIEEGYDADLVVVGSRGHSTLLSMLLGSVSHSVIQHSRCPIAVIHRSVN